MSQECLRTGDKALVHFRFIKHPEYIKPGLRLVIAMNMILKYRALNKCMLPVRFSAKEGRKLLEMLYVQSLIVFKHKQLTARNQQKCSDIHLSRLVTSQDQLSSHALLRCEPLILFGYNLRIHVSILFS